MSDAASSANHESGHYSDGRFHNEDGRYRVFDWSKFFTITKTYFSEKSAESVPSRPIPVLPLSSEAVRVMPDNSVVRLAHSMLLLKLGGDYYLTDPMFGERVSSVSFIGTKRFHPMPLSIGELPPIRAVLISHDHYDHLDRESIVALDRKVEHFYAPLGVGCRLAGFGVAREKISELDWWQSTEVGEVTLTATPVHHFSGRGLFDGNKTLWASWVIRTPEVRLLFSGDSGYFDGFKTIGDRFGPFDMTFVEAGAYHRLWREIHMFPQQSVQAHVDIKGKVMVPIHNGSFDLAMHAWHEPLNLTAKFAEELGVDIRFPRFGEVMRIINPAPTSHWWK